MSLGLVRHRSAMPRLLQICQMLWPFRPLSSPRSPRESFSRCCRSLAALGGKTRVPRRSASRGAISRGLFLCEGVGSPLQHLGGGVCFGCSKTLCMLSTMFSESSWTSKKSRLKSHPETVHTRCIEASTKCSSFALSVWWLFFVCSATMTASCSTGWRSRCHVTGCRLSAADFPWLRNHSKAVHKRCTEASQA